MYMYKHTFFWEASKTVVFSVVPRPCSWPVGGGAAQLRVLDRDLGGETGPTHIQDCQGFVVCLRERLPACRSKQWPAMFPSATWNSLKSINCCWKASFSGNGKRSERTHALSWWGQTSQRFLDSCFELVSSHQQGIRITCRAHVHVYTLCIYTYHVNIITCMLYMYMYSS